VARNVKYQWSDYEHGGSLMTMRPYVALPFLIFALVAAPARAADPAKPAAAPTATPTDPKTVEQRGDTDKPSGENLIGAGRATDAVKSSGDQGGTAAGMPSNRAADGR
jgi:hypothetical protein